MKASVFALATLASALATPALAQNDGGNSLDDIPHITIVGTAQTDVRPDLATITLGVTTEETSAASAAGENARKSQAVIDAAKTEGVPATDIATQSVNLTQTFDQVRDPTGRITGQRPRGYAAHNTVSIKLRDLAKAGTIAERLIDKGANQFNGVAFSVEHPEPVMAALTGTAVKNARAQALAAADAAEMRLGRVLTIEPPGTGAAWDGGFPRVRAFVAPSPGNLANSPMPLEAGTQSYSTSIAVTWALDPK